MTDSLLDLQINLADWRSKSFRDIDATVSAEHSSSVRDRIANSITEAFREALSEINQVRLPDEFDSRLQIIIKNAYRWNTFVKRDVLKYEFESFIISPGSEWNEGRMEPFEAARVRGTVKGPVISTTTLGLIGRAARGGENISRVQLKAKVLVKEWFATATLQERTNSIAVSDQDVAAILPPKPSALSPVSLSL